MLFEQLPKIKTQTLYDAEKDLQDAITRKNDLITSKKATQDTIENALQNILQARKKVQELKDGPVVNTIRNCIADTLRSQAEAVEFFENHTNQINTTEKFQDNKSDTILDSLKQHETKNKEELISKGQKILIFNNRIVINGLSIQGSYKNIQKIRKFVNGLDKKSQEHRYFKDFLDSLSSKLLSKDLTATNIVIDDVMNSILLYIEKETIITRIITFLDKNSKYKDDFITFFKSTFQINNVKDIDSLTIISIIRIHKITNHETIKKIESFLKAKEKEAEQNNVSAAPQEERSNKQEQQQKQQQQASARQQNITFTLGGLSISATQEQIKQIEGCIKSGISMEELNSFLDAVYDAVAAHREKNYIIIIDPYSISSEEFSSIFSTIQKHSTMKEYIRKQELKQELKQEQEREQQLKQLKLQVNMVSEIPDNAKINNQIVLQKKFENTVDNALGYSQNTQTETEFSEETEFSDETKSLDETEFSDKEIPENRNMQKACENSKISALELAITACIIAFILTIEAIINVIFNHKSLTQSKNTNQSKLFTSFQDHPQSNLGGSHTETSGENKQSYLDKITLKTFPSFKGWGF